MPRLIALALLLVHLRRGRPDRPIPRRRSAVTVAVHPAAALGGAPAPPVALPVPAVPRDTPRTLVTRPNRPAVEVPGGPGYFSNKVERCLDAAANAGLGPNARAAFTRRCAN